MAFMAPSSSGALSTTQRAAIDTLVADLRTIFGGRLMSLVAYGLGANGVEQPVRTLGLVERVTFDDLAQAVPLASAWRRRGLAVPLILSKHEFDRTLDVFPLEYGSIIADHVVIVGDAPFAESRVGEADRRRGCEQQAKSHLIHLREGFLETENDPRNIARLISSSAPAFRTLLVNLARLEDGTRRGIDFDNETLATTLEDRLSVPRSLILEVLVAGSGLSTVADVSGLLARYIDASERIWRYVDGWRV